MMFLLLNGEAARRDLSLELVGDGERSGEPLRGESFGISPSPRLRVRGRTCGDAWVVVMVGVGVGEGEEEGGFAAYLAGTLGLGAAGGGGGRGGRALWPAGGAAAGFKEAKVLAAGVGGRGPVGGVVARGSRLWVAARSVRLSGMGSARVAAGLTIGGLGGSSFSPWSSKKVRDFLNSCWRTVRSPVPCKSPAEFEWGGGGGGRARLGGPPDTGGLAASLERAERVGDPGGLLTTGGGEVESEDDPSEELRDRPEVVATSLV